jgi:nicotinate-nucleotide pyrophosphorylase (carboxylating)
MHNQIDDKQVLEFIRLALQEDVNTGDYSTLSCIPPDAIGQADLKVKQEGILAGVQMAKNIFQYLEPNCSFEQYLHDGAQVKVGDIAFSVKAGVHTILKAERLALNVMQRMSAIATLTNEYVQAVKGTKAIILDTRKTTPMNRFLEKWAVRIGGGQNHRMGLYDMIMLKDNHIDFAGGITKAVNATQEFLKAQKLDLKIEVETRNIEEVKEAMSLAAVDRIMLDNFSLDKMREAVEIIAGKVEVEASGGVNLDSVRAIAACGVDFISVGALTHGVKSMDLSLKAQVYS